MTIAIERDEMAKLQEIRVLKFQLPQVVFFLKILNSRLGLEKMFMNQVFVYS